MIAVPGPLPATPVKQGVHGRAKRLKVAVAFEVQIGQRLEQMHAGGMKRPVPELGMMPTGDLAVKVGPVCDAQDKAGEQSADTTRLRPKRPREGQHIRGQDRGQSSTRLRAQAG